MRSIVLGAGVIGTTTAYYLARHGLQVTVVDRQRDVGLETSFANGGIVHPSMTDPWAAPGVPLMLLKGLGQEDAPFLFRARALPGVLGWGIRFLCNCTAERWRESAEMLLRIAVYSRDALDELSDETGIDYDRGIVGTLKVFRDDLSMEAARRNTDLLGGFGLESRALDTTGCLELEPALAPIADKITGGIHYPGDRAGDAYRFTRALAALCTDMGVTFELGRTVTGLKALGNQISSMDTDKGEMTADAYVLAMGSYSPQLARQVGIKLPIYPVKGYSVTVSAAGWNKAPIVPVVDDGRKIAVTPLGDRLRVAGTVEFTGFDASPNQLRANALLQALTDLYPEFTIPEATEHWSGFRPLTPDDRPILGRTPYRNLFLNTGHGHLGWTLACGSGRLVADLLAGREPEISLTGFTLARYQRTSRV